MSDFVFLDDCYTPYLVHEMDDGAWWLYYWNEGTKGFVSLRQIEPQERHRMKELALPVEQAVLYGLKLSAPPRQPADLKGEM